jgi:large subunit ribosomal protein L15
MHYIGLEGGNIPLFRKIPKRGFNSPRKRCFQTVNLGDIAQKLKDKSEVGPQEFKQVSLIRNVNKPVKILADGAAKLEKGLTIKANKFSKKAKETIEKAGGKAECLQR